MIDLTHIMAFTPSKHVVYTSINILVAILIFIRGQNIYNKTANPKVLILSVGIASTLAFTLLHLIYSLIGEIYLKTEIHAYSQFIYHSTSMLILSISGLVSALYIPKNNFSKEVFRSKVFITYIAIILLGVFGIEIIKYILPEHFIKYVEKFVAYNPSLEIISNAMFVLTSFIYSDIIKTSGKSRFSALPIGYFILGVGTIYLFTADYLLSNYRSLVHIIRDLGLILIFTGLKSIPSSVNVFSYRQKILAYPALLLMIFSLFYFGICFILFDVELPEKTLYVFLVLYLITLVLAYIFSSRLTAAITKSINYVEKLVPGVYPDEIEKVSNDEIGLLTEKIQASAKENWQYMETLKDEQEKIKKINERESLLKNITESIRASLDLDKTLEQICIEITKVFNVERTAIATFSDTDNRDDFNMRKEYNISNKERLFNDSEDYIKVAFYWRDSILKTLKTLAINNVELANVPEYFKKLYRYLGVKSIIGTAIRKEQDVWGSITLSTVKEHRQWTKEEINLLEVIANQLYIAIKHAEVFEKEKKMVEQEKINRNIIEILRSSIEKQNIKNLFVKNIGEYLNADRVIFADYDPFKQIFLPVDKDSEYLSSSNYKSFVGIEWNNSDFFEKIQQLFDKKEIIIKNAKEIKFNNNKSSTADDIENELKSCYAFPVLYEQEIKGFFCIEFIKQITILSNEDLERIRNICTQTGIALAHAELYEEAKACFSNQSKDCSQTYYSISQQVKMILESINALAKDSYEDDETNKILNKIINSCNAILSITTKNN